MIKQLQPDELAYIAGLFDGEGNIGFTRCRDTHYIRVLVVNTNKQVLEYLKECFGGDINPLSGRKDGWKQAWIWRLSWGKALGFISAIRPWLKIKSGQADIALCWDHYRPRRGSRIGDSQHEVVAYLRECMTFLNKRGEHSLEDPLKQEYDNAITVAREIGDTDLLELDNAIN